MDSEVTSNDRQTHFEKWLVQEEFDYIAYFRQSGNSDHIDIFIIL